MHSSNSNILHLVDGYLQILKSMAFQATDRFVLKSNLIDLDAIIQKTYYLDKK